MATLTKPSVLVTAIKKPMDLQHFFQLLDMLGKKFRRNTRNADKKYKKPHNWTDLAGLIQIIVGPTKGNILLWSQG